MGTPSCPEAPPCTQESPTECRRRSLLHQRESTLFGSEDPSLLLSPPSNRCGSPSRNMMSLAPQLSTENASKKLKLFFFTHLRQFVTNAFFYQCRGFVPNLNIVIVQLELN